MISSSMIRNLVVLKSYTTQYS